METLNEQAPQNNPNNSNNPSSPKIPWMKYILKVERIATWILLVVILAFGVTGYGMTKGFISQEVARTLHLGWLGAVGIVAFTIHTFWGIHLTLKRHRAWNRFSKIGLITAYALVICFFGWMHFFYGQNDAPKKPVRTLTSNSTAATTTTITATTTAETTGTETGTATTTFTAETLKTYNGLNGQPAYVAVDGIVYDMSSVFQNGDHHGYSAGQNLTSAFHSEHSKRYLKDKPIVGTYTK